MNFVGYDLQPFDYNAPAELFLAKPTKGSRTKYRRFATAALQELFGVNADIRATCDELAAQGFIAIAPDLFWRQEPEVAVEVNASHVAYMSHPKETAKLIEEAATSASVNQ